MEAKRVAGEQRAREIEERRDAERRERADRTEGPAARTRDGSTRPAVAAAARGIAKERGLLRAKRRGRRICARGLGALLWGCWSRCIGRAAEWDDQPQRKKSQSGPTWYIHVGNFH